MPLVKPDPLLLLEPAPCDHCRHRYHCEQTGEACRAFWAYLGGRNFDFEPKQPRADIGKRLGLTRRPEELGQPG